MNGKQKKNNTTQLTEARKSRWNKPSANQIIEISDSTDSDSNVKCTGWQGGYITILDSDEEEDCDLEFISGEAVIGGLQREWRMKQDLEQLAAPTVTEKLMKAGTSIQWAKKGPNLARINKPEINLPVTKFPEQAERFHSQFTLKPKLPKLYPPSTVNSPVQHAVVLSTSIDLTNEDSDSDGEGYCGYLSELSDDDSDYAWEDEEEDLPGGSNPIDPASSTSLAPSNNFQVHAPPPLKHQKLDVPACKACVKAKEATVLKQQEAWVAIQKLITSKKDLFESGCNELFANDGEEWQEINGHFREGS
ncbi:hypothetical protein M422DRAFT_253921 [Sphaerobolus stellatus SS14]|uniref:Uncharacterized protein n=1 Tax=Sphaerobolus stellatus (strain SS14) TaxID=990650 RepID=A0A0C9UIF2_SPHS4|nr:hypothetical protein M422DRAFT_253921 [Sphaerobolus stellatus SS14]